MAGWNTIERIRRLEVEVNKIGFKFNKSRHSDWSDDHGALSLVPIDSTALPIYTRDAELFVGSIEALEHWVAGVRWAREYDRMLKLSDDKKRAKKEDDVRGRNMLRKLAGENPVPRADKA
jgi:hypothetical protein